MAMRYRVVIFDWDGTLMDSVPRIVGAMQAAARDLGLDVFTAEQVRNIVGLGLPEAIHSLAPFLAPAEAEKLRLAYVNHFVAAENGAVHTPLFTGVEQGLMRLHRAGIQLAVATGKSHRGLNRAFGKVPEIASLFSACRTADTTRSKPDPLMLEQLLHEVGAHAGQAVMIGDSEYDIAMAGNIGMDAVGVTWGVHAPERLSRHGALWVADDFPELIEWLMDAVVYT